MLCVKFKGATMVPHDSEDTQEVGHCYDPGCYSRVVNYNATIRQMNALVKLSQQCRQHIRVFQINSIKHADCT